MPGFVPGIHVLGVSARKTRMAGTSPAMTIVDRYDSMSSKRRLSVFSNRFTALEAAISSWLT